MDQRLSIFTLPRWMRIPRYLHRAAIPILIILAGSHLNAPHHSWLFSTVVLSVAGVCLFIENPRLSFRKNKSSEETEGESRVTALPTRRELAFSLIRATVYAFIGDAAAAYILYDGSLAHPNTVAPHTPNPLGSTPRIALPSTSTSTSTLSPNDYLQLGLAASMWALGALLWVMEPPMYWIAWRYQLDHEFDRSVCMEEGYDPLDDPHPPRSHRSHRYPRSHGYPRSQPTPTPPYLPYNDEVLEGLQPPPYPPPQPPQSHRLSDKS